MTRNDAVAAAEREAVLFGLTMTVYRLPAWPPDVYGVRARSKLPSEALTIETFDPPAGRSTEPAIPPRPPKPVADPTGQGSLFS